MVYSLRFCVSAVVWAGLLPKPASGLACHSSAFASLPGNLSGPSPDTLSAVRSVTGVRLPRAWGRGRLLSARTALGSDPCSAPRGPRTEAGLVSASEFEFYCLA